MSDPDSILNQQAIEEVKAKAQMIVERFANRVGNLLVRESVDVIKSDPQGAKWRDVPKSITYEFTIFGTFIKIVVFSSLDYAFYAHEGRGPGGVPPIWKIRDWVRLRGIAGRYSVKSQTLGRRVVVSGKSLSSLHGVHGTRRLGNRMDQYGEDTKIAEAIAWKIAKHGTTGLKFFDIALRQALPKIIRDQKALLSA
jgi:hypothetical protein